MYFTNLLNIITACECVPEQLHTFYTKSGHFKAQKLSSLLSLINENIPYHINLFTVDTFLMYVRVY